MATRDLGRLAKRVKAHRLELYPSRLAAAQAAGISKDTWFRIEEGQEVREATYAKVDRALGWITGSCLSVAEGLEPLLADSQNGTSALPTRASRPMTADALKRAAFEAARAKLPNAPIGDIDAFGDELVEVLRKTGQLANGD
ncbi:hypothetical protein [Streptomyces chartreusis]|uniref:hypothetical protein n=1 Tax=Streptomyces chartreusis TaxID=1969 RepID=UPI003807AFD8